jgi:hypothetical protein
MCESTITLTFGDAGENHVGMELLGKIGDVGSGFTCNDLKMIKDNLDHAFFIEYFDLNELNLNIAESAAAAILVIRNFAKCDKLFEEMNNLEWDKKYLDIRRKKVLNKLARHNIMILDGKAQEPDYENGKGIIIDSNDLPEFQKVRERIMKLNNLLPSPKFTNLICEGNKYYNTKKCGIGYHGDSERRKVVGLRLGNSLPLHFQWYYKSNCIGKNLKIVLNSGDLYIMSEKAVGYDWKKRNIFTLRHSAGCDKYTKLKSKSP